MATPEKVLNEIQSLTADLISVGLCVDQNFPSMKREAGGDVSIGFSGLEDLSLVLKNIPYADMYSALKEKRSYNLRMIDGALIQMLYLFRNGQLVKHRLAMFPSPDLLEYQNNSEIYEEDELYGDIIMKNVVTTPVRFDFDRSAFIDYEHPMSHFTIGQYKNCRIPVTGPLSPFFFLNFVLRSFYNTPFMKFCQHIRECKYEFERTITVREQRHIHLQAVMPA